MSMLPIDVAHDSGGVFSIASVCGPMPQGLLRSCPMILTRDFPEFVGGPRPAEGEASEGRGGGGGGGGG